MTRKPQPTPYHYTVRTSSGPNEEEHALLLIGPSLDGWESGEQGYSFAETIDAYRSWMDAVTAAAVILTPELDAAARHHRCRPSLSGGMQHDACGFNSDGLEEPLGGPDDRWLPGFTFIFPAADAKSWNKRIVETVERIRAIRAWRPTAEEEAAWSRSSALPDQTAPNITSLLPERRATSTEREG